MVNRKAFFKNLMTDMNKIKLIIRLKSLEKDNNYDGTYYIDQYKRVWLAINDQCIRPERFDIYAHICKINDIKAQTNIYNSYSILDTVRNKIIHK